MRAGAEWLSRSAFIEAIHLRPSEGDDVKSFSARQLRQECRSGTSRSFEL